MKKLINLCIVFVLLTSQTITAGSVLGDALSSMTNVNSFDDGTNSHLYTGSASVRFNFAKRPAPLFTFTPPEISAGCNGIDLKGMTMSLLNIDQLGGMLKDAGASLAWGVAVGLIYSLPGVASAFKMINSWAKKIQDLLSQACATGIKIGEAMVASTGYNKSKVQNTIDGYFNSLNAETYVKEHQKGEASVLATLGFGGDGSTEELTPDKKREAVVNMFKAAFQSDASTLGLVMTDAIHRLRGAPMKDAQVEGVLGINRASKQAISAANVALNQSMVNKIGGLLESGSSSLTSVAQGKLSLFAYVIQFNFIGDIAITLPQNAMLAELFDVGNPTAKDDAAKNKAKHEFKKIQGIKMTKMTLVSGMSGIQDEKTKGKSLADFIWYGVSSFDGESATSQLESRRAANFRLVAPRFRTYVIADRDSASNSAYISVLPADLNGPTQRTAYYDSRGDSDFSGSLSNSRCIIDELVLHGKRQENSTCSSTMVFPEVYAYVKIIKNSPISKRGMLKDKLIKAMAAKMATALLNSIQESLSQVQASQSEFITTHEDDAAKQAFNNTVDANAKESIEKIQALRKSGSIVIESAYRTLTDTLAEGYANEGVVESLFETQARENRTRGLRSIQK